MFRYATRLAPRVCIRSLVRSQRCTQQLCRPLSVQVMEAEQADALLHHWCAVAAAAAHCGRRAAVRPCTGYGR